MQLGILANGGGMLDLIKLVISQIKCDLTSQIRYKAQAVSFKKPVTYGFSRSMVFFFLT